MKNRGFTLIEILISLSILVVGIVGILALFPAGLNSTKLAIEDTYAAIVAESAYASLRASAAQVTPLNNSGNTAIIYFHDGIKVGSNENRFNLPPRGSSISIPDPNKTTTLTPANYTQTVTVFNDAVYCPVGREAGENFDITMGANDPGRLGQYSFNIELTYPTITNPSETPKGLFDVVIRVRRGKRLVKKFYSKIAIPTHVN